MQYNASTGNQLHTTKMKPVCVFEVLLTPTLKMTLFNFTAIYTSKSYAVSDSIAS
jgi:hypothetical protein